MRRTAAFAETGNFAEAASWQEKALAVSSDERRKENEDLLEQYRSGVPHRMSAPGEDA